MLTFTPELLIRIHREILGSGDDGFVRRVEPDGGEELLVLVRFDEGDDAVHDDAAVIAAHVLGDGYAILHVRGPTLPRFAGFIAPAVPVVGSDRGIPSGHCTGGGEKGIEAVL